MPERNSGGSTGENADELSRRQVTLGLGGGITLLAGFAGVSHYRFQNNEHHRDNYTLEVADDRYLASLELKAGKPMAGEIGYHVLVIELSDAFDTNHVNCELRCDGEHVEWVDFFNVPGGAYKDPDIPVDQLPGEWTVRYYETLTQLEQAKVEDSKDYGIDPIGESTFTITYNP